MVQEQKRSVTTHDRFGKKLLVEFYMRRVYVLTVMYVIRYCIQFLGNGVKLIILYSFLVGQSRASCLLA